METVQNTTPDFAPVLSSIVLPAAVPAPLTLRINADRTVNKIDLRKVTALLPATAKKRRLDKDDAELMAGCLESALKNKARKGSAVRTVRVYADGGFVPNAYKWRCDIEYVDAVLRDDGKYAVGIRTTSAKRAHGAGDLVTINGRGALE
jgi:hypothetical protein